jgi:hypothetical protein
MELGSQAAAAPSEGRNGNHRRHRRHRRHPCREFGAFLTSKWRGRRPERENSHGSDGRADARTRIHSRPRLASPSRSFLAVHRGRRRWKTRRLSRDGDDPCAREARLSHQWPVFSGQVLWKRRGATDRTGALTRAHGATRDRASLPCLVPSSRRIEGEEDGRRDGSLETKTVRVRAKRARPISGSSSPGKCFGNDPLNAEDAERRGGGTPSRLCVPPPQRFACFAFNGCSVVADVMSRRHGDYQREQPRIGRAR